MDRAQRVDEVTYLSRRKWSPKSMETTSETSKITQTSSHSSLISLGFLDGKMIGLGRGRRDEDLRTGIV